MPERVVNEGEISLNTVLYKLRGPVQPALASVYPTKVVMGDVTRDSQQRASVIAWSDFTGGIGIEKLRKPEQLNRCWWSTAQLRSQGHLLLPALTTRTGDQSVSGVYVILLGELASEIYGAFGTTVKKYNNVTDGWGASLATLTAAPTDIITVRLGATVYLVFAQGTDNTYTSNGTAYTNNTTDVQYMTAWDGRLWGIDSTGQLRWTTNLTSWTNDAQLPLPNDYVTDLFVARDAGGDPIIYASTKVGLFAHDALNNRFVETELKTPFHDTGGLGSVRWRDSTFIPVGLSIYRYISGPTALVATMGPDRDGGLPSDRRGYVRQLLSSHNELLAVVDGTSVNPLNGFVGMGTGTFESEVISQNTGYSSILGFNEIGWEVKWTSAAGAKAVTSTIVSNAYDRYRMWWIYNQRVYFMPLPTDIVNPSQTLNFEYDTAGDTHTPWFDADQADIDKLGLALRIEVDGASATETIVVSYALNYATTWTSLGTITTDGTTEYLFPNATTPTGTSFRAIRFRIQHARGTASRTVSPDVISITFIFRKKLPVKWGFMCELDLNGNYKDRTPDQLRDALNTAIESATLVEFTYRDDTGNTRNFYVDVLNVTGIEMTGHNEKGLARVLLAEP